MIVVSHPNMYLKKTFSKFYANERHSDFKFIVKLIQKKN